MNEVAVAVVAADYLVEDCKAFPNDEAQALRARYQGLRKEIDKLDAAGVAASVGRVFAEFEWLECFTMDLSCESVMGDEGGSFLSVNLHIGDVGFVDGVELVEDGGEEIDENQAAGLIEQRLEHENYWIMESIGELEDGAELSLTVKRPVCLRGVKDASAVRMAGIELLKELFPEKATSLGVV